MYIPQHFEEPRIETMHALMRARPLATLATLSPHGLAANHIPLLLDVEPLPFGRLRGHVARANPLWREAAGGIEALAIFHGPDSYITPSWYATKRETGKAVPTWNYAVVHARGELRVIDDAAWLRDQLAVLTACHEAAFPAPWSLADAPPDYIDGMIAAVVGVEIVITQLAGKWKVSQNQPPRNRAGVVSGLAAQGSAAAAEMAALVKAAAEQGPQQ